MKFELRSVLRRDPELDKVWKPIIGRQDQKDILARAVTSEEPTQVLLNGPPASAKSLFGELACDELKGWKYINCATLSRRGFIEWLDMNRGAKVIFLDEIDKLNRLDQTCMYNFLDENRRVQYQVKDFQVDFRMPNVKVIATCNSLKKLNKPLISRFLFQVVPGYTEEEFKEIATSLFKEKGWPNEWALIVAKIVWDELESRDVRMIKHIRGLLKQKDTEESIAKLLRQLIAGQSIKQTEYNL